MNTYAVIMAGGGGTRFWPLSRQNMPKQLLNLSGTDAMINETIKRFENIISPENTYIVTNKSQAGIMKDILLKEVPTNNILSEPSARNTAACILYAAMYIYEKCGDGIMCVFPSDHYIVNEEGFQKILLQAIDTAKTTNSIVTIGIKPTFPSTGYGYIKSCEGNSNVYKIDKFEEKPNLERAKEYLADGNYYWNSGMFIWKISVIIEAFKRFLPRIYNSLSMVKFDTDEGNKLLNEIYPKLDSISVDYGIMERTDDALVIPGDFGWNDVGSWDALGAIFPSDENGNIIKADYIGIDTNECIIYGDKKLITTVGLKDIVVVDTDDAIMVCNKNKAQDVKQIVDKLKEYGRKELL